ncbi:hypothetical protein [Vreelandella zhanjiangensis]|uniref:hypothetical protein n=1 Tax=Vreelandella zhanjiangensis TaxID=1121960 RepID=UPI00037B5BAA|nr:hypothetical protein [Halomonas zhanjiangensis]
MNNKLVPIIIDNPCQKGLGYRIRDVIITTATLILWLLVLARLYTFFIIEEAILEQLYGSLMIKVVAVSFIVTFLTFHCWAVYNQFLYTSILKRQARHMEPPTLEIDNKMANEQTITAPLPKQKVTEAHTR